MRRAVIVCVAFLTTQPAYAWGPLGHEYIGAVAERILAQRNPDVLAKVKSIAGMDLRLITTWADCVKDVSPTSFKYQPDKRYAASCQRFEAGTGKADMEDYVRRNSTACSLGKGQEICHKQYHYSDVAIQHCHYDRAYIGTSNHDVVAAINAAIAVLQGKPAPVPFNFKDQREALYVLAHLIGDIHQPLHVGAVYLDPKVRPADPDLHNTPAAETRGGNSIGDGSTNLHTEWDDIPTSLKAASGSDAAVQGALSVPSTMGNTETWAAAWATDTVAVARTAFQVIRFTKSTSHPTHWGRHLS